MSPLLELGLLEATVVVFIFVIKHYLIIISLFVVELLGLLEVRV